MASDARKKISREEAYALIADLTEQEKLTLYEMLSVLRQNPQPAEPQKGKDQQED
jgi:hypothetical protein